MFCFRIGVIGSVDIVLIFVVKIINISTTIELLVPRTTKTTWDPRIDNNPKTSGARVKFSKNFSSIPIQDAHRILDIGCGIGKFTYLVRRQNTVGIDLELEALKTANKFCTGSNFVLASALALPFRNGIFDLVLMWEIIEHIPIGTETDALSEIYRISCLDSKLLLSTPYYHFVSNLLDPAFIMYGHRHYRIDFIGKPISQAGFSIQNCIIRGGWFTLIAANISISINMLCIRKEAESINFLRPDRIKNFKRIKMDSQTYSFKLRDSINWI
jgi:SAM-dependent methyltransferase